MAHDLAVSLSKDAHRVDFVSYESSFFRSEDNPNLHYTNVEPYKYPLFPFPIYELALAEKVAEIAEQNNADIIHAHYGILFGHAAQLAQQYLQQKGLGTKLVVTFHGSDVMGFDFEQPGTKVPKRMNISLLQAADALTAVSRCLRSDVMSIYGFQETDKNIQVIHNGIDITDWTYYFKKRKQGEEFRIIHFSNFRKVKCATILPEIARVLKNDGMPFHMTLVGDGPEVEEVLTRIREHKLEDHVSWVGKKSKSELKDLIRASDALLLPSMYESMSLAILECAALGVPAVASKRGGIPEIVDHMQSGLLVENIASAQDFADAIKKLASNEKLRSQLAHRARKIAESMSDVKTTQQYTSLYEEVLQTNTVSLANTMS